jgi:hypothetical protein
MSLGALDGNNDIEDDPCSGSGVNEAFDRLVLKAAMNLNAVGGRVGDPCGGDCTVGMSLLIFDDGGATKATSDVGLAEMWPPPILKRSIELEYALPGFPFSAY